MLAVWAPWTSPNGTVQSLTGNSGGVVFPDSNSNINVVGDGTTINIVGNPGTNTLTASLVGGAAAIESFLTDDSHVVTPTMGQIVIHGTSGITTSGTVGPNTITISSDGTLASSFITSPATGTAIPAAGVLTFAGTGSTTVSAAGSTITINSASSPSSITITGDSGGGLTGNSFTFTGGTTGLTFSGSGSTETLIGDLVVANGGTGKTSFTAYAPITGGTSSTNPLQSADSGISNVGYVLTSTGNASLPTWQAVSGGNGKMVFTIGPVALNNAISAQYSVFNYNGQSTIGPYTSSTLIPYAGTISTMYMIVADNANTATANFTIMKNGVDQSMTIAVGAGATGTFTDLTHSFSVAAGDVICLHADHATTGTTNGSLSVVLS
jgi:hypothetical protein